MKENENQEPSSMAGAAKGGNTSKEIVGSAVSAAVGEPVASDANDLRDASAILEREGYRMHAMALRQIAARLAAPTQVSAPQALAEMEARKDAARLERNQVVAALAKCFPSGVARTAIEGWSEDWHGCVYIDLPTGQVSWHFQDSQAYLFDGLPAYQGAWDGHDTPEKYRRVAALQVSAPQAEVLIREAREVFDLMLDGCNEQEFGDFQNGHGETIGKRMDALHAKLRAFPGAPQAGQEAQASAAQEVRAVPEGLERLTRYMFTHEGMEVDNACGRYYLADEVDAFVERRLAAPTSTSTAPAAPDEVTGAARDVLAERQRQVEQKGYEPDHDDEHKNEEIAAYAAYYAMPPGAREWPATETGYAETFGEAMVPDGWTPTSPGDRRRELVKAGALILAEIERIDRAALRTTTATGADSPKGDA